MCSRPRECAKWASDPALCFTGIVETSTWSRHAER
ncbi:hypothetical protein E2C01_097965 [Portunus trituberculatus]|uniref:Uncharacterized protein n=1 Tax=Portunus trituberculatus TaxID=210409 RepID=A0A5B7K756_PORTR|nr:hypothetical protein [Portunus trituberculatus]